MTILAARLVVMGAKVRAEVGDAEREPAQHQQEAENQHADGNQSLETNMETGAKHSAR